MAPPSLMINHQMLAGVGFAADVMGTLGSLYLTDELLQKRYRILGGLTALLTFGIPLGLSFAFVGGIVPALLAGGLNGVWMALRVMGILPGGYSFSGVFQWAVAYGLVASFTHSPLIALYAALTAVIAGSVRYTVRGRDQKAAIVALWTHRSQVLVGAAIVFVTCALMIGAAIILHSAQLLVDYPQTSTATILLVAAFVGWFSSAGPSIVKWARSLPAGGLGAIGLVFILAGFIAQAMTSLPGLLNIPVH